MVLWLVTCVHLDSIVVSDSGAFGRLLELLTRVFSCVYVCMHVYVCVCVCVNEVVYILGVRVFICVYVCVCMCV